jgi:hypothetical protein
MGYHEAKNPMSNTTDKIRKISVKTIFTGYAEIRNDPLLGSGIISN